MKIVLFNISTKFTGKHLCQSLFLIKLIKILLIQVAVVQVFFCEFCEIFNNTFFKEHLRVAASELVFVTQILEI